MYACADVYGSFLFLTCCSVYMSDTILCLGLGWCVGNLAQTRDREGLKREHYLKTVIVAAVPTGMINTDSSRRGPLLTIVDSDQ